jgi:hypothetical protein
MAKASLKKTHGCEKAVVEALAACFRVAKYSRKLE